MRGRKCKDGNKNSSDTSEMKGNHGNGNGKFMVVADTNMFVLVCIFVCTCISLRVARVSNCNLTCETVGETKTESPDAVKRSSKNKEAGSQAEGNPEVTPQGRGGSTFFDTI